MTEHHKKTDRVERWLDLPVPVETVWAAIGDFCDLKSWLPGVESSERAEIGGAVHRHVKATSGALFLERLVEEGPHLHRYTIEEGALPVENYLATLTVFPQGDGCRVFWSASFDSENPEADRMVAAIFEGGLRALDKRFGPA